VAQEELLDTVIKSYQDKLRQNPDSLVFVQLADALRKKGRLEDALGACRSGLTRHPNLLSGLLMMGRVFLAKKEHGEAVEVLKKVVQREPNNLTSHALLSQAFMALGGFQEAIGEYQKILSLNPEDEAAQSALQVALDRMRREGNAAQASVAGTDVPPQGSPAAAPASVPANAPEPPPAIQDLRIVSEVPAYAAAMEMAERGLYDEAIEALQRVLEADPDNFMARQKLREVYAQREVVDTPTVQTEAPSAAQISAPSHADKISDDEILYLLGLMESGAGPSPAPAAPVPAAQKPAAQPAVASRPGPDESPPVPPVAAPSPAPEPEPERPATAPDRNEPVTAGHVAARPDPRIVEILNRLGATNGMRSVFLVSGYEVTSAGAVPAPERAEKIVTLVRMLSDVTRRTATQMKQGEMKQLIVFGTEGLAMVSACAPGILAAVTGAGVNVGLLRIALNDCLKRLGEVS